MVDNILGDIEREKEREKKNGVERIRKSLTYKTDDGGEWNGLVRV